MEIETLARMAGQISANFAGLTDDQAVTRIADHLKSFWTPAMLDELGDYAHAHPTEIDPRVTTALSRLGV